MCISASPKKLSSFDFLPVYKLLNFFFFISYWLNSSYLDSCLTVSLKSASVSYPGFLFSQPGSTDILCTINVVGTEVLINKVS